MNTTLTWHKAERGNISSSPLVSTQQVCTSNPVRSSVGGQVRETRALNIPQFQPSKMPGVTGMTCAGRPAATMEIGWQCSRSYRNTLIKEPKQRKKPPKHKTPQTTTRNFKCLPFQQQAPTCDTISCYTEFKKSKINLFFSFHQV